MDAAEEYVTIRADELPEGSLGRRLAAFLPLHADGEDCWCGPAIRRTGDTVFVEHHVVATDGPR